MNKVSKYAEINCSSLDNLHFPLEGVNIEIWVFKATVWKLLLSRLEPGIFFQLVYTFLKLHDSRMIYHFEMIIIMIKHSPTLRILANPIKSAAL